MYRCIDVHPEDAQYRRILWRAAEASINVYALTTLTFGTASAPFMAIRVIQQLAKDEQWHTIEDAADKRAQVSGAITSACMELRKWSSNEESLLQSIPPEHQCSRTPLNWDTADPIKALGMYWLPNKDCFKFQVNFEIPPSFTKRTILSSTARLFDPLGLIAPVIFSGKLILKEVTLAKKMQVNGAKTALDWDDEVPKALAERWQAFRDGLLGIDGLSIQRHVGSENPADCATRGLPPSELKDFDLWWQGPEWLTRKQGDWPSTEIGQIDINDAALEAKADKVRVHLAVPQPSLVERFSSFSQAVRVTAFIIRFKSNAISKGERCTGPLSIEELDYALPAIVRIVQRESFSSELTALMNSKRLPPKKQTSEFVTDRSGGHLASEGAIAPFGAIIRTQASNNPPKFSYFYRASNPVFACFDSARRCVADLGLVLDTDRETSISKGATEVRQVLSHPANHLDSAHGRPAATQGQPPNRPFLAMGVDYTGAIELKAARLRGTSRFHLSGDEGYNLMKALFGRLQEDYEKLIAPKLAAQRATWHFNPPQSPNFGGLWEANVKSVKHHLKRVIADRRLTYEKIIYADADDLEVLTPAHFLIGDSRLAPPEYRPQSKSFAEQFLIHQSMIRHFWKAWSRD
ncbi:uncharacterized protein [Drosophila kikkawai]|uniref:Uncharacterized protein n=1 Tax=Drosophila kikkawai TaxID=30033 RepID=A0ABM4GHX6_DROKI